MNAIFGKFKLFFTYLSYMEMDLFLNIFLNLYPSIYLSSSHAQMLIGVFISLYVARLKYFVADDGHLQGPPLVGKLKQKSVKIVIDYKSISSLFHCVAINNTQSHRIQKIFRGNFKNFLLNKTIFRGAFFFKLHFF